MASVDLDVRFPFSLHRQYSRMDDCRVLGREPWIIYNLMRTAEAYSENVSTGNAAFTLLGFMGMYAFISVLFLFMMFRVIGEGPSSESRAQTHLPITTEEVL